MSEKAGTDMMTDCVCDERLGGMKTNWCCVGGEVEEEDGETGWSQTAEISSVATQQLFGGSQAVGIAGWRGHGECCGS